MSDLVSNSNLLLSRLNEFELWYKNSIENTKFYQYMPRKHAEHETSYWPIKIDFEPRVLINSHLMTVSEAFKAAKIAYKKCKKNKFKKEGLEDFLAIMRGIFSGTQMKEGLEKDINEIKRLQQLTVTEKVKRIQNVIREYTFSYASHSRNHSLNDIKNIIGPFKPRDTILKEIKNIIDPSKPIKSKKEETKYSEWYKKIEDEIDIRKEELRALLERTCNFMDNFPPNKETNVSVPEMSSFLITLAQRELTERYIYALEAIKDQIDLKRIRTIGIDEKLFFNILLESERQIYVAEEKLKQIKDVKETTRIRETLKENLRNLHKQVEEGERILLSISH